MPTIRKTLAVPFFAGFVGLCLTSALTQAAEVPKYIPNNTEGLLTVNVKQLLEAPVVKEKRDTLKLLYNGFGGEVQKALESIGLDPFTDLDRVSVAIPNGQQPENSVVLVQGKFDVEKFKAAAEKMAKAPKPVLAADTQDSYAFWALTPAGKDTKVYLALLDDKVLVASGNRTSVVEALQQKAGKLNPDLNREFVQLVARANLDASVSFVGMPGQLANAGVGGELFGKLQSVVASFTLTEEVALDLTLNARNQDEAKQVNQMAKGALNQVKTFLQVQASKNPDVKPAVEAIDLFQVKQNGNAVTVTGRIAKELLDKLLPG